MGWGVTWSPKVVEAGEFLTLWGCPTRPRGRPTLEATAVWDRDERPTSFGPPGAPDCLKRCWMDVGFRKANRHSGLSPGAGEC